MQRGVHSDCRLCSSAPEPCKHSTVNQYQTSHTALERRLVPLERSLSRATSIHFTFHTVPAAWCARSSGYRCYLSRLAAPPQVAVAFRELATLRMGCCVYAQFLPQLEQVQENPANFTPSMHMLCKSCANEFKTLCALLQHQSISGCRNSLAAASMASPSSTSTSASAFQISPSSLPPIHSVVALDCEMVAVQTEKYGQEKSALARVALVDWNGRVLLDTYVKPNAKVR